MQFLENFDQIIGFFLARTPPEKLVYTGGYTTKNRYLKKVQREKYYTAPPKSATEQNHAISTAFCHPCIFPKKFENKLFRPTFFAKRERIAS